MRIRIRDWRTGFGVPGWVAAWLPPVGLGAAGLALLTSDEGDIRAGIFPFAMALAVATLLVPVAGVLSARSNPASGWSRVGAVWTAVALASLSVGLGSIAVGALLGIQEDAVGPLSWVVVAALAFGLLAMTPAMALFAYGVSRDRLLPRFGRVALWVGTPVLPALLVFGGLAEGTVETIGSATLLLTFGLAWVAVGVAVGLAHSRHTATLPERSHA